MKKVILSFFLLLGMTPLVFAQSDTAGIIQFSGQVLTEYGAEVGPVPFVNIYIKEQPYRGTYADESGFFSLVAKTNETVVFSALGFRKEEFIIPSNLEGDRYSIFQFMEADTVELPEAVVYPWPSREHFKIEFLAMDINNKLESIAMENLSPENMARLAETLPVDGRETVDLYFRRQAQTYYSYGQFRPMPIFSPLAWSQFFKALKNGEFKDKRDR